MKGLDYNNSGNTFVLESRYGDHHWSDPKQISFEEFSDRIEVIYKQREIYFMNNVAQERVYKIIYSVVDGKWHKSERIFGKIIPKQEETYEFDESEGFSS